MTKRKKPKLEPVYILSDAAIDALGKNYLSEPEDLRRAVPFETWLRCHHVPVVYDDGAVESGVTARLRVDRLGSHEFPAPDNVRIVLACGTPHCEFDAQP